MSSLKKAERIFHSSLGYFAILFPAEPLGNTSLYIYIYICIALPFKLSVRLAVCLSPRETLFGALINAIKKRVHYGLNVFAVCIPYRRVGYELPTPAAIWAITRTSDLRTRRLICIVMRAGSGDHSWQVSTVCFWTAIQQGASRWVGVLRVMKMRT